MTHLHYGIGISLGMEAAKRSAPRVPAKDKSFMDFVKENCKELGSSIPVSKGWLAGYETQVTINMKKMGF